MDVKSKFSSFVSSAEKKTKNAIDSTLQTVTQNIDTKIDFSDVSQFADTVGNAVKKGALSRVESACSNFQRNFSCARFLHAEIHPYCRA